MWNFIKHSKVKFSKVQKASRRQAIENIFEYKMASLKLILAVIFSILLMAEFVHSAPAVNRKKSRQHKKSLTSMKNGELFGIDVLKSKNIIYL